MKHYEAADKLALDAFHRAAERVPGYREVLKDAGVVASEIVSIHDFGRLPLLEKRDTFQRFPVAELCVDGDLGRPAVVLTSSGHLGVFSFGLSDAHAVANTVRYLDDVLDYIFSVRSRPTLLINCLPMGVKVHVSACTVAETSVRADMVVGLVKAFGHHYEQIILVSEAAFAKAALELGEKSGVDWSKHLVHVVLGEEPVAENARKYIESLLSIKSPSSREGIVCSSMGMGEVGMHFFTEVPPVPYLILLRRALHDDTELREAILGECEWVHSIFTYDPKRIRVEFDATKRLVLTTVDPEVRVPLIRYVTGDTGSWLKIPEVLRSRLESVGVPWEVLESTPLVMIAGRGRHGLSGKLPVYPEAVKEGIYLESDLARLTTANFRIVSGEAEAIIRLQLGPGIEPSIKLDERFARAIRSYVRAPIRVRTEAYDGFGSGMTLDFERKFDYLGP